MYIGQLRTYVLLVHRCRRFFPAGADQDIWDECWPALPQVFVPQSFEVSPVLSSSGHLDWVAVYSPPCMRRDRMSGPAYLQGHRPGLLSWGFGGAWNLTLCTANA